MAVLGKSMEILNSKPEERAEADKDIFGKMVAVTLKRMNPYQKIIARKKINDILFEIELSDYKQQQSHPTNEHFRGPINTSNNSNMISLNPIRKKIREKSFALLVKVLLTLYLPMFLTYTNHLIDLP